MESAFLNPRFFHHFDPARWEDELCAELAPALRRLLAELENAIASMAQENVKAPDPTVLPGHPPSPAAFAEVGALCAGDRRDLEEAGPAVLQILDELGVEIPLAVGRGKWRGWRVC